MDSTMVGRLENIPLSEVPRESGDEMLTEYLHWRDAPFRVIRVSGSLPSLILAASEFLSTFDRYDWFQLDDSTRSVLRALISLQPKILYRLKDRRDLPAILSVLEHLSRFLYAVLPEHKTYMGEEQLAELHQRGMESLSAFVSEANNLTDYLGAPKEASEIGTQKRGLREKAADAYSRFVLFRFILWVFIMLFLTSGCVFVFQRLLPLSPDAMAAIVIGTSIAGASALAGFLPRQAKED
jgi:hypothetical protein